MATQSQEPLQRGLAVERPLVYCARVHPDPALAQALNEEILSEIPGLRAEDAEGRDWSTVAFPGGYCSYMSIRSLEGRVPAVAHLAQLLGPHVEAFRERTGLALPEGACLSMTQCWLNAYGEGTELGLHEHPGATVSGTYYVRTPEGCPGLSYEACEPGRPAANREIPAVAGEVVLFASSLRHGVAAHHASSGERVSVSFNYHWRSEVFARLAASMGVDYTVAASMLGGR